MFNARTRCCGDESIAPPKINYSASHGNLLLRHVIDDWLSLWPYILVHTTDDENIKDELPFYRHKLAVNEMEKPDEREFCQVIDLYCFVIVEWVSALICALIPWGNKIIKRVLWHTIISSWSCIVFDKF